MFGESSIGDTGHSGENSGAGMPDSTEICGCNGVCKGTIVKAIREQGLFTVDEIKKHTKAASSCGSCTGLVEQILRSEEHTSELQSLMRISYAVFCLKKKITTHTKRHTNNPTHTEYRRKNRTEQSTRQ